jgi:hypothetical protein
MIEERVGVVGPGCWQLGSVRRAVAAAVAA